MKKSIILILIGLILGTTITVTAALVTSANNITFSSEKTDKTNVKEAIDELYTKTTNGTQCSEGKWCMEVENKIANIVNIGDYISMTPTSTSYTPLGSDTGCMNDSNCTQNTLNPSELNLWRVIRKNADGTVEVVSEFGTNELVYFNGKEGYFNLVGGLNTIAAQYTNEKYVQGTRHMGYSNQIEKCTYLSTTACPNDTGYTTDITLVKTAIGTLIGKNQNGIVTSYYLASRDFSDNINGYARIMCIDGSICINSAFLISYDEKYKQANRHSIRPILTLKADIKIVSGDGKSAETAYEFK